MEGGGLSFLYIILYILSLIFKYVLYIICEYIKYLEYLSKYLIFYTLNIKYTLSSNKL